MSVTDVSDESVVTENLKNQKREHHQDENKKFCWSSNSMH